jgi:pyrimidine-specific ribonucleoside hydrolase
VVIDTDPGIDDLVALALALRSPNLEIAAVTTTYGTATLESTTRNARELLCLAQRSDIPVRAGRDRPLVRDLATAPQTHGITGAGYAKVPAPVVSDGQQNSRVLLEVLAQCPHPIVLVTLGPLTNLALALRQGGELVRSQVALHVGMFGNLARQAHLHRWADFNAWCDPEAADEVLRAGINTLMVGLDVTQKVVIRPHEVRAMASSRDALARWLGEALRYYLEAQERRGQEQGCAVHDAVVVGEVLSPGLLQLAEHRLLVDLDNGVHRGHTRLHSAGHKTRVAVGVDQDRMHTLLAHLFGDDRPWGGS